MNISGPVIMSVLQFLLVIYFIHHTHSCAKIIHCRYQMREVPNDLKQIAIGRFARTVDTTEIQPRFFVLHFYVTS